jgi:hypothetical protein
MAFITKIGEEQIALKQGNGQPLKIVSFVLANIDGIGDEPVNRVENMPYSAQVVDTLPVTRNGYVNGNQVIYSLTMGSTLGDYDFNWIGLVDDEDVLIAVTYIPTIQKRKTSGGIAGNTMTRNFLIVYSGIQAATGIDVPAETWQINFDARLYGIDERERIANYDTYGHESFFDESWKVTRISNTSGYSVTAGVGYVGGIRVTSSDSQYVESTVSQSIWMDVSLQGNISDVTAFVEFIIDSDNHEDYTDSNSIEHYLTKIAEIKSDGSVEDLRNVYETLQMHKADEDPHHQYKEYAEEQASNALSSAKSDATTKANSALASAKSDATTKDTAILNAAKLDATTKANAALASAKSDATTKDTAILNAAKSDATTKANAALSSAKSDAATKYAAKNATGVEFGEGLAAIGNQFFFGKDKEHNLFDNDGQGNAGIKLGVDKSVMTVDGGAFELEANIDGESNPSWSIAISEGDQEIGSVVNWSDYDLKGAADGTLTWGGENIITQSVFGGGNLSPSEPNYALGDVVTNDTDEMLYLYISFSSGDGRSDGVVISSDGGSTWFNALKRTDSGASSAVVPVFSGWKFIINYAYESLVEVSA